MGGNRIMAHWRGWEWAGGGGVEGVIKFSLKNISN